MRILFLHPLYYPDASPSSELLSDLTLSLAAAGHDVSVLTSTTAQAGATPTPKGSELWRGIRVRRIFCGRHAPLPSLRGSVWSLRFAFGGMLRLLLMREQPEVIIVVVTAQTPGLPALATFVNRLRRLPFALWIHSLPPAQPAGRAPARHRRLTRQGYVSARAVIIPGESMMQRIQAAGAEREKLRVFSFWADEQFFPRPDGFASARLIAPDTFVIACTEVPQSEAAVDLLLNVMERLQEEPRIRFHFLGDAPFNTGGLAALQDGCHRHRLRNAHFFSMPVRKDLAVVLGRAHLGLVLLSAEFAGASEPRSPHWFIACGRPFLCVSPPETTPARIVATYHCGWQIEDRDVEALAGLILRLYRSPEEVSAAGLAARRAFEAHFTRRQAVQRFETIIQEITRSDGENGTAAVVKL